MSSVFESPNLSLKKNLEKIEIEKFNESNIESISVSDYIYIKFFIENLKKIKYSKIKELIINFLENKDSEKFKASFNFICLLQRNEILKKILEQLKESFGEDFIKEIFTNFNQEQIKILSDCFLGKVDISVVYLEKMQIKILNNNLFEKLIDNQQQCNKEKLKEIISINDNNFDKFYEIFCQKNFKELFEGTISYGIKYELNTKLISILEKENLKDKFIQMMGNSNHNLNELKKLTEEFFDLSDNNDRDKDEINKKIIDFIKNFQFSKIEIDEATKVSNKNYFEQNQE